MNKQELLEIIATAKKEIRELTEEERKLIDDTLAGAEKETKEVSENKEIKEKSINTKTMKEQRFSVVKAIRNIVNNTQNDDLTNAVLKAGESEARKAGLAVQGMVIPTEERAYTVSAEGEDVVATDLWDILMPLRAKSTLAKANAKFYTNLTGNVQIPIMSPTNCYWENETGTTSDGTGAFSSVTLSAKRISCVVPVSKALLAQDSIGVENAIREDLSNALAQKIEESFYSDFSGDTKQPEGIFHVLSANTVSGFSDICDVEAKIEDANAGGEIAYVMSNKAKAALRGMAKGTKSTQLVYENGAVDGTKALSTSLVSGKKYIVGDFSNVIVGIWGTEILTDPYTLAGQGCVRLVVNAYVDFKATRPETLAAGTIQ